MLAAARRSSRIVQMGQWQRSGPQYAAGPEDRPLRQARQDPPGEGVGVPGLDEARARQPDAPAPAGVDYDMWLGPAPKRPFNPNRFHFNFRWFWDYAGGLMTDWGVHLIDIALWAMDAKAPKSVVASRRQVRLPRRRLGDPGHAAGRVRVRRLQHALGARHRDRRRATTAAPRASPSSATTAPLVVNRGGWEVLPETHGGRTGSAATGWRRFRRDATGDVEALDLHTRNFVEAIRKNDASILTCGIETGSVAAINAHMGNIAFKIGRKVFWDAATGAFKGDAEANALLVPQYHNGWKLPKA